MQMFNLKAGLAAAFLVFGLVLTQPVHAQKTINFEGLNDSTPVTTQYSADGVTFSHATAITAGVSLDEVDYPPHSGSNVVFDDGGPITGVFSTPIHSVSGYFTYTSPLTFTAFDSSGGQIASVSSLLSDNTTSSGNAPNEFLQLSSPLVISSFTIAGDPAGGSFTLDDLHFSPKAAPVPEASSAVGFGLLLLLAFGGLCLRSRPTHFLRAISRRHGQALPLKILPCVVAACLSLFIALPAQAARTVATPTANADYVFVKEAQTVTLTAQVSPDPQLITTAVKLVRVDGAGKVLGIFPMYDDGTHGDKTAGDGLYTAQVSLNEPTTGTATFYVTDAYRKSLLRTKSQPLNMRVVLHLNQAQVTEYVNSLTDAGNEYAALIQTEPASQARPDLVKYLLTLPDVSSAGITPDGTTVYFMIFGNLEEDVETDLFESDGSSSSPLVSATPNLLTTPTFHSEEVTAPAPFGAPAYVPLVGNRKALLIAPFYDQFSSGGGDETATINDLLMNADDQVDYFKNGQATVNVFKTMSKYGVIVISTHGYLAYWDRNGADDGNVNFDTREEVTTFSLYYHLPDILAGRIRSAEQGTGFNLASNNGNGFGAVWAIEPAFVYHYGGFQNSLVYVGSCFSLINTTMAQAFLLSGARTYFGYTDEVSTLFSDQKGIRLFSTLSDASQPPGRRTTQIAYSMAGPPYVDPFAGSGQPYSRGPAIFEVRGSEDLALDLIDHITITPTSPSVTAGNTLSLTATVYDNKGEVITTAPDQLQWSSDTPTIATVDANGVVTGMAAGTANITVTDSVSGKASDPVTVTVLPSLDHINANAMLLIVGGKATLTAVDANDNPAVSSDITWRSSKTSVATVDMSGNPANATGKAVNPSVVITATQKSTGKSASITFRVADILGHWVGTFTYPNNSTTPIDLQISQRQDETLSVVVTIPNYYTNELFVQDEIGLPPYFDFLAFQVALPYYAIRGTTQGNSMDGALINPNAIFNTGYSPFTATRQRIKSPIKH